MRYQTLFVISLICLFHTIKPIEFKIVDEDYIEIPIGGEKRAIKLLIDPVGHFTYIFRSVLSSTKEITDETFEFNSIFGNFKGHWERDYLFPTPDRTFGFKLKYLMIDSGDSHLNVDGVIGLGYTDNMPDETNIIKIFSKMKAVFPDFKKLVTYDKKNSKLVIGSLPPYDSYNPVAFDIVPNDNEQKPFNFVNLTQLGFYDNTGKINYVEVGEKAKFGLMPLLVAPKYAKDYINPALIYMTKDNKVYYVEDEKKLFENVFYNGNRDDIKPQALMLFGKVAYKFTHTWTDEEGKTSSSIRIANNDYGDYWYIGVDKLNINRADFDYETMKVTMYSTTAFELGKSKLGYVALSLLLTISFTTILTIAIRYCCAKKKTNEIKLGEELVEL